jgi:hypothetical protein
MLDLIRTTNPDANVKKSMNSLMCVMLPYENKKDYMRVLEQLEHENIAL